MVVFQQEIEHREPPALLSYPELSIIIPAYNVGAVIGDQLVAIALQECSAAWEVIVADNGSVDDTVARVRYYQSRLPALRLIDASGHPGASFARNEGARAARGKRLVFVDADDIIAPGFLQAVSAALEGHRLIAPRIEATTLNRSWASRLGQHPQYRGLMRYYNEPHLLHASGSGLAIHRPLFFELGGFDESLPRLMDSEFCFRAQLAGVPMHFAGDALIYMRNRETLVGVFEQARKWGRAEVQLVGRYRVRLTPAAGAYRWARYIGRWFKLFVGLLRIRSTVDLAHWFKECARQIGILQEVLCRRCAPI